MILALDTTTPTASVGLYLPDGGVVFEDEYDAVNAHGESLLPRLDALMRDRGLKLAALRSVVVCLGPGSFNGVRIGLSTAVGLRLALGIEIYGATSFERERASAPCGVPVLVSLEAGRGEVYAELCDAHGLSVHGALVCTPEALEALVADISGLCRLPTNGQDPQSQSSRARKLYEVTRTRAPMREVDAVYVRPPDITLPKAKAAKPLT